MFKYKIFRLKQILKFWEQNQTKKKFIITLNTEN